MRYIGMPFRMLLVVIMWATIGVISLVMHVLMFPSNITNGKWWDFVYTEPMEWVTRG